MWHIYNNLEGKLEVAFVVKGKYIVGSRQGYEKKKACYKAIVSAKGVGAMNVSFQIQDDVLGIVFTVSVRDKKISVAPGKFKLVKPYKP